ncbi:hypothetical protein Taro_049416 [Colocasia esculenta]|uniref:Uncharacterized protein n=1 Tax=Colocasia esculenta TaxID=4460 RepID=A0A843XAT0_COLES|nr:hypothetical protein [Colocasia esculenta]
MVRGGRTGRGSTSVGRGVRLSDYAGCPNDKVRLPEYAGCPGDMVRLPDYTGCPGDRVCLLNYADCPDDRVRLLPSSVIFPIPMTTRYTTRGKIDLGSASRYITSLKVDVGGPRQGSEYHRQPESYGLDGLRTYVDEEGLLRVPLSSLGYWTMAGERHELERAPTFRELFDQTHKWKGIDDYVSESALTIAETYVRTMVDHYAEGTPQPDLDPET